MVVMTVGQDCDCEQDMGFTDEPDEEPCLFTRTCQMCGCEWGSGHCPHDGVQRPCPDCGWIIEGGRTPMQRLGFAPSPPTV